MNLLELPPVLALRRSFRWKLLATLLGSVALLAAVTLAVVRSETSRQIELASQQAEQRSQDAFVELEQQNRAAISQRSTVFTGSVQAAAALEAALEGGDTQTLLADVNYEFEARRIPHSLVAFTDAYGEPVLAMLNSVALPGADPADVATTAEQVLYDGATEVRGYRVVDGGLYTVETLLLDLGRPIGTVTIGVPITDEDAAQLGSVIGAEVCFVVADDCVAGTAGARAQLQPSVVAMAGAARSVLARIDGERWRLVSDRLTADDDRVWRVIAVPLDPVIAPFERVQNALLVGGLVALLLAGLVALLLANGLTRPVKSLLAATSRVGAGDYAARVDVRSVDEIGALGHAFNDMAEGLALKERYRGVLDKVVSRDIAEELLKGDVALGGETRQVTTMFADIAGFTRMTDGMRPTEVIALLNECMQLLTDAVEREGGVVDKYIGDEIMALFGAPVSRPEDPLRAVRAALGMQQAMRALNQTRSLRGEHAVQVSIGMNTGAVMAGNMGSSNRLNYTVLGDAVNMAARVEQLAGSGQIMLTEHTLGHVREYVDVRDVGLTELRGFAQPVRLYELLRLRPGVPVPETRQQRENRLEEADDIMKVPNAPLARMDR